MKYTPGKWGIDLDSFGQGVVDENDRLVADCSILLKGRTEEENQANAKLIAAAPDMVEALKKIVENEPGKQIEAHTTKSFQIIARAALKKAGVL